MSDLIDMHVTPSGRILRSHDQCLRLQMGLTGAARAKVFGTDGSFLLDTPIIDTDPSVAAEALIIFLSGHMCGYVQGMYRIFKERAPEDEPVTEDTVADSLSARGLCWSVYADDRLIAEAHPIKGENR